MGNGTWLNVGGNQAVTTGGNSPTGINQAGAAPYDGWDGGKALRILDPCDDESCDWLDDPALYMTSRRWYPTLETLEDGSAMIFGGCEWGGYVNFDNNNQNNPTVEVSMSLSIKLLGLSGIRDSVVLAVSWKTFHPQFPHKDHPRQPLPARLAPPLWKHLHTSRIPGNDIRLQEQYRVRY